MKRQIAIAATALLGAAASSFAMPQKAADITVSGYTGSGTLENFPVLVRLAEYDAETGKGIQGFSYADCATGGLDISFEDAGGNLLAHEIDTWNPKGESLVWVRVPSLSGKATTFTMRWKDAAPPSVTASDVWSADYAGVWHLGEEGLGGTSANSTANGSILDGENTPTTTNATGKVGNGRQISDSTDTKNDVGGIYVDGSQDCTKFDGVFTISGWFWHRNQAYNYDHLFYKREASGSNTGGIALEMNNGNNSIAVRGGNNTNVSVDISTLKNTWSYLTFVYNGETAYVYQDGECKNPKGAKIGEATDNNLRWVFGNDTDGYGGAKGDISWKGVIDEVRLRTGASSADWVKAEYQTMALENYLTYGSAYSYSSDGVLVISGSSDAIGSPTPAYGKRTGLTAGAEIPVACPVWTNETGTAVYSCTGWKLYNGEGEVVDSGAESAFTYVHPSPAAYRRLEWQWTKSGKVPSAAGGTVSGTLVYAPGDTVTLTATPAEGYTFFRWTGDIGNADPAEPTVTFTAASAEPVAALFGTQLVVASDGSGDYTSLNAAVAAATDNTTILVRDGTYVNETTGFLAIAKPIKIVSENGCDTTFFRSSKNPNSSNVIKDLVKGIQVNHALAIVKGLTFFNFGCDGSQNPQGLGVYLQQGLVENCVISNTLPNHGGSALHVAGGEARHLLIMKNTSRDQRNGAGVYMTGGTVTNCVIRNNSAPNGGGAYVDGADAKLLGCTLFSNSGTGGGVYLASGLVQDCVITNNSGTGGGVYQTDGTLANCLVQKNRASYTQSCGGVYSTGGTIADCTILANTAYDASGRQLRKTAGELRGTTAGEGLHAIPSSDLVSVANGVTVADCALQCPGIAGATLLNASETFGEEAPRIVADKTVGLTNLVVAFSLDGVDAASCAWTFGDGATPASATGLAPTATFTEPGAYTVAATVTTAGGATLDLALEIHALASDAYVSKAGSATFPYDTPEKATDDLNAAAAAVFADDDFAGTVHVAADTYTYGGADRSKTFAPWILVNKGVRVEGPDEGVATFDAASKTMNLFLFHPRAVVSGLTFYRGKYGNNSVYGGNLHMTAGTITNCAFTSGSCPFGGQATMRGGSAYGCTFAGGSLSSSGTDRHAGGLNIEGGTVTVADCLIRNNSGCYGGGLHVNSANAVVTNCVIRGNSAKDCGGGGVTLINGLVTHSVVTNNSTGAAGGGVQMSGGKLRNCVVAFNKSTNTGSKWGATAAGTAGGGGLNISNGTAENCTFYGDTSASGTRCDELSMSGGTVRNCLFLGTDANAAFDVRKSAGTATHCYFRSEVAGDGNVTGDAKVKGADAGDFTLLFGSVCLDAGMEVADVATDIRGAPRPVDGNDDGTAAWDIGAYEMDFAGQLAASFEADVTTGGGETAVTLTASVSGGTAPYTYTWTIGGETIASSEPTLTYTFGYGSHDVSLSVADATGATSETVTRSGLVQIKAPVVYVSTAGTAKWPYDTWEKATDDWTAALTAVYATDEAPGTVLVADGTYTAHDSDVFTAAIAQPIHFLGTNAACGAVFNGQGNEHKVFSVNHAKALVANLTLSNCKGGYGDNSGALWLYDGTVSNCVFTGGGGNGGGLVLQMGGLLCDSVLKDHDAGGDAGGDRYAGGLNITGGTAERLVISGNADGTAGGVRVHGATAVLRDSVIRNNTSGDGGAVLVDSGLVENCVISNNTNTAKAGNLVTDIAGAGATVRGGTLRNCLIVGNRSTGGGAQPTAGSLFVKTGSAYNNTVWDNTLSTGATNDIYQISGTAKNNIAGVFTTAGGAADGNYAGDNPGFRDLAAGDYSLRGGSLCKDIGDWTVWGETRRAAKESKDMVGNSRLCGHSVDAGCYEYAARGFTLSFR